MKSIIAIMLVTVPVSFGQQIPVFKVDYSTQDGTQLVLTNARVAAAEPNPPYLRGAWAVELEKSTNSGQTWQGIFTNTTDILPATGVLEDVPLPPQQPSKAAMTDTMLGYFVNYRAKVAPCLNCKMVVAYHFRPGWNGFTPPFTNKYLKRVMQEEWVTINNGVSNEAQGSPWTAIGTFNRVTGGITFTTGDSGWPGFGNCTFPFSTTNVGSLHGWTVADDHFQSIADSGAGTNPRYIHTTDVWLSQPMTMGMAEHDTQGLIDRTITNAPWGSITSVWWGDCDPATCGDSGNCELAAWDFFPPPLCPPMRMQPTDSTVQPCGVGSATAAGSLFIPCNWSGWTQIPDDALYIPYDQSEMYMKWGSMVRGPWGWTLNTRYFATSFNSPAGQGTQFVDTDCGGIINIQAPPPDVNTNWGVTATPANPP